MLGIFSGAAIFRGYAQGNNGDNVRFSSLPVPALFSHLNVEHRIDAGRDGRGAVHQRIVHARVPRELPSAASPAFRETLCYPRPRAFSAPAGHLHAEDGRIGPPCYPIRSYRDSKGWEIASPCALEVEWMDPNTAGWSSGARRLPDVREWVSLFAHALSRST